MKKLCIIATGGTMDKIHDPITESLVFSEVSFVPELLEECRADKDIKRVTIMLKDSLDVTDKDREKMVKAIQKRKEEAIVVTHGTSTMDETALYLKKAKLGKTIVLTGALRPFSFLKSDAPFNLGCAMIAAKQLKPGVYIAMSGSVFKAGEAVKDLQTGEFKKK